MDYFKQPPFAHQSDAFAFTEGRKFFALLMEQGTGKTPVDINDTARRWIGGEIDTNVVLAPNGVQTNWTRREIPKQVPDWVAYKAAAWTSGMNRKEEAALDDLCKGAGELRFLTMNWEALTTAAGQKFLLRFIKSSKVAMKGTADESQRFKNHKAERTKALLKIVQPRARVRSIMSGSPIVLSPWDAWTQMNYLDWSILKEPSNAAFRATYAVLLPQAHGVLRHLYERRKHDLMARYSGDQAVWLRRFGWTEPQQILDFIEKNGEESGALAYYMKYGPQIVAKDPITELPQWKNLDKLEALIRPHAFRVLKKDCLDLPDKVYTQTYFKMTTDQRKTYDLCKNEFRLQLEDGSLEPLARLAALTKLSQITSGYFLVPGTKTPQRIMALERNPKILLLLSELETCIENGEQFIIWARFQQELKDIAQVLKAEKITFSEYHGEITRKSIRNQAIDDFESGRNQGFLSQQQAGGTGLTLIAPKSMAKTMTVIYYSNTFAGEDRWQSEDRAHRIGQEKTVRYNDFMAEDSVDEGIADALRNKKDAAAIVTGDSRRAAMALLNFQ